MRPNLTHDSGLAARGVVFDPATMVAGTAVALKAAGTGISAVGTLSGGNYAAQAGRLQKQALNREADQLEQNATGEIATGQRQALDKRLSTKLLVGTSRAIASGSGVDPSVGSAAQNETQLNQRGEYHALLDMFAGENAATGLRNKAKSTRFAGDIAELEGEMKKKASRFSALGTLASGLGSTLSSAGGSFFPTPGKA